MILDLEDSVHRDEKDAARILVRNTLRAVNFGSCERMVRINQLPLGLDLRLREVTAICAREALGLCKTGSELNGRVAVLFLSAARDDLTAVELEHCDGDMLAVL